MNFSVKGKYGVAAIVELALHPKGEPVQIRHLSQVCGIPQNYLEQILVVLKREGFVKSFRGAQGGYILAKPASEISINNIIGCLEGPSQLVEGYCGCDTLTQFWADVDACIAKSLEKTIKELAYEKQQAKKILQFSI